MPLIKRRGIQPNEEAYDFALKTKTNEPMISETRLKKQIMAKFDMPEATARGLVHRVLKDLSDLDNDIRPYRKTRIRAVVERTIEHCMQKGILDGEHKYLNPLLRAVQELAKLDGLYTPEQIEVKNLNSPVDTLTNAEKKAELNEILKKYQDKGIDLTLGANGTGNESN